MVAAQELKKGDYIIYNNEVLQVIRREVVAYGTHSHSKTKLFVKGLFSKGEKSFNLMHSENIEAADIRRKSAQVVAKMNGKAQIMDNVSYETLEAGADPELLDEINEGDQVTYIDFKGNVKILEKR